MKQFDGINYQIIIYESNRNDFFSGFEFNSLYSDKSFRYALNYPKKDPLYKQLLEVKTEKDIDELVVQTLGEYNL